jgi:hypothetical protein
MDNCGGKAVSPDARDTAVDRQDTAIALLQACRKASLWHQVDILNCFKSLRKAISTDTRRPQHVINGAHEPRPGDRNKRDHKTSWLGTEVSFAHSIAKGNTAAAVGFRDSPHGGDTAEPAENRGARLPAAIHPNTPLVGADSSGAAKWPV